MLLCHDDDVLDEETYGEVAMRARLAKEEIEEEKRYHEGLQNEFDAMSPKERAEYLAFYDDDGPGMYDE
jgi:hypothetical protein